MVQQIFLYLLAMMVCTSAKPSPESASSDDRIPRIPAHNFSDIDVVQLDRRVSVHLGIGGGLLQNLAARQGCEAGYPSCGSRSCCKPGQKCATGRSGQLVCCLVSDVQCAAGSCCRSGQQCCNGEFGGCCPPGSYCCGTYECCRGSPGGNGGGPPPTNTGGERPPPPTTTVEAPPPPPPTSTSTSEVAQDPPTKTFEETTSTTSTTSTSSSIRPPPVTTRSITTSQFNFNTESSTRPTLGLSTVPVNGGPTGTAVGSNSNSGSSLSARCAHNVLEVIISVFLILVARGL